MTDQPVVLRERRGRVGVITMNRPAKLNALSSQLVDDLDRALREMDADADIGAIVLTGAGERAFSAGGDMAEQVAQLDGRASRPRTSASATLRTVHTPVLAAIRGYCYGGGALLAIGCDIRIAGDDARFKFHGASYGFAPGGAVLPRIVGDAKARELLFTGDDVPAAEALRIGLVNQVVSPELVVETAVAMAARIAANSPTAVAAIRETIDLAQPIQVALDREEAVNRELRDSPDSAARFRRAAERVVGPAGQGLRR